jgi:hypothetical protein
VTHESSVFGKYERLKNGTDAAAVRIPAYCPDTPETRADRALYYDNMRRLDAQVGKLLKELEEDGLAEETIVFYYGDNGGVLPRSKRFAYDSGLHVPLIVRVPEKWKKMAGVEAAGSRVTFPVSFVDFAPTVLSLAGVEAPKYFQGKAFLGPKNAGPREFAFGFRDRMDERYDMVRTVRDERYRYIRNYRPEVPWGQHVQYMFQQAGYRAWEKLHLEGKLPEVQERFWGEKPAEELYDLKTDPDEVKNLAGVAEHRAVLDRMRGALRAHLLEIRDNGFIPESSPLEGFEKTRDAKAYPLERIIAVADVATQRDAANLPKLVEWMGDENECVRYWAGLGCVMLREKAAPAADMLEKLLADPSGSVRVVAAEGLCRVGRAKKGLKCLAELLLDHESAKVRLQAANAIDHLGPVAKPIVEAVEKAARGDSDDYVKRATRYTAAMLRGRAAPMEGQD